MFTVSKVTSKTATRLLVQSLRVVTFHIGSLLGFISQTQFICPRYQNETMSVGVESPGSQSPECSGGQFKGIYGPWGPGAEAFCKSHRFVRGRKPLLGGCLVLEQVCWPWGLDSVASGTCSAMLRASDLQQISILVFLGIKSRGKERETCGICEWERINWHFP